ncbi:unnamed protein product [Cladocopium goreaui]|uniref:E3 ubiquitin-protein ligase n=1 Tax=Cladocopium goreaui TaxID=2562237 RepID=A0A9P1GQN1_9DINO|nr:unnamed protein product [Cladocopium goreaui]
MLELLIPSLIGSLVAVQLTNLLCPTCRCHNDATELSSLSAVSYESFFSKQVLKQTELEVFTKKKHENLTGCSHSTTCSICLSDFEESAMLRRLPCGHAFHQSCSESWLSRVGSCPLCRGELVASDTAV